MKQFESGISLEFQPVNYGKCGWVRCSEGTGHLFAVKKSRSQSTMHVGDSIFGPHIEQAMQLTLLFIVHFTDCPVSPF